MSVDSHGLLGEVRSGVGLKGARILGNDLKLWQTDLETTLMSTNWKLRNLIRKKKAYKSRVGKTCKDCRKYSRKTFYCTKLRKVFDQKRDACENFAPRGSRRRWGGYVR